MNTRDLATLIEEYRNALEAKLVRLVQLQSLASRQLATSQAADIDGLRSAGDQRDVLTSEVVTIDRQIRSVHERLTQEKTAAHQLPGFNHAASLDRTVAGMVQDILATDRVSIRALEEIAAGRLAAAHAAEQAVATLAAYARMASPRPTATLVNGRG